MGTLPQGTDMALRLGGTYTFAGGSGGGVSRIEIGQLTPLGGNIVLNRNDVTPDAIVVSLNEPIARSDSSGTGNRGSVAFQTKPGQALGAGDNIVFADPADAPKRINGSSGTMNMVAPWLIGSDRAFSGGTVATFLDINPATASTIGFAPTMYSAMPQVGGTGNEIADNAAAISLTGPVSVGALRTSASISGQSITLVTGGLIITGRPGAPTTISSALDFGAAEGVITNSGTINFVTGKISGSAGLTKLGADTLTLGNAATTLTGGITIDEGVLRPGIANGIPQNNVLTINSGGVLEVNGFNQAFLGLEGEGLITSQTGATAALTLNTISATDRFDFSGSTTNTSGVGFRKVGPGTQVFSGALSHTGATDVVAGTLLIDGASFTPSAYTVRPGAVLGGSGNIRGSVSVLVGGKLAPGDTTPERAVASFGIGGFGTLDISGGIVAIDLNGSAAGSGSASSTGYDQLDVVGVVRLLGSAELQLALNYIPTSGDKLFIVNNDDVDSVVGVFARLNGTANVLSEGKVFSLTSSVDGQSYAFQISYRGEYYADNLNVGNDVVLVAVPEPLSSWQLGSATAAFMFAGRWRRKT